MFFNFINNIFTKIQQFYLSKQNNIFEFLTMLSTFLIKKASQMRGFSITQSNNIRNAMSRSQNQKLHYLS